MDPTKTTLGPYTKAHSGLANSSSDNNPADRLSRLAWVQLVCFSVIVIVGLIGNFLIGMAILKRPKLRIVDYFVLNLAATDLAICIISIPFDFVVVLTDNWPFGSLLCKIVFPLQTIFMAVSVYTLLLMSWERHRVVMPPSKPKFKTTRAIAIIFLAWVVSIALVGPYFAIPNVKDIADDQIKCDGESGWPSEGFSKAFTLAVFILLYLLPLLTITANYIRISQKLWRDIQRLRRTIGEPRGNRKPLIKARAHRNMRIVKVFVVAVAAFAACMAPNHVLWLWYDYGSGRSFKYFEPVLVFCHILVYANSAINPFIFVFLHSRYCKHFLLKYCLSICCKDTKPPDDNNYYFRRKRARRTPGLAEFTKLHPNNNAHGMRNYLPKEELADQESPKYDKPVKQLSEEDADGVKPRKTIVNFKSERGVEVYQLQNLLQNSKHHVKYNLATSPGAVYSDK